MPGDSRALRRAGTTALRFAMIMAVGASVFRGARAIPGGVFGDCSSVAEHAGLKVAHVEERQVRSV